METLTVYRTSALPRSFAPPPKRPMNSAAVAFAVALLLVGLVLAFEGCVRGVIAIASCLAVEELSR